jgi:tRNA U34 5-carboxymethylaminomethyl modifying GTPase MnmE/TrmE
MPHDDRVSSLLAAYFTQPYVEYGEVVLEIRGHGGLTAEEVRVIKNRVLSIDAKTMIRHAGTSGKQAAAAFLTATEPVE